MDREDAGQAVAAPPPVLGRCVKSGACVDVDAGVLGLAHHSHHFGLIRTDHVTFRRLMFMFVVSITRNTTALRFHCPSERQALDLRQPTRPTPFGDESEVLNHASIDIRFHRN